MRMNLKRPTGASDASSANGRPCVDDLERFLLPARPRTVDANKNEH